MSEGNTSAGAVSKNTIASSSDYVGLTKSVLELISSSNPVIKLAHYIISWLGRECINETDFRYCLERSCGIAYPNEHGLTIRQSILHNENRLVKVGGLHLITAGAIGRWMAFSQDHAYMVTTVAVTSKYQGTDYAANLLLHLVLGNKYGFEHGSTVKFVNSYSVDRARLKGVIVKIVESISLNVVNPGHTLGDLPEELRSVCVHFIAPNTFARICSIILGTEDDMMLLCDRFPGALLLWFMTHFEGSIEVSVVGKTRYRGSSLYSKRRLVMVVGDTCWRGCQREDRKIDVLVFLNGKWNHLLTQSDSHREKVSPTCRQPLYTTKSIDKSAQLTILNREELYQTKILAQRAVLWMVDIDLVPNGTGFRTVFPSSNPTNVTTTIRNILYRWPSILHDVSGKSSGSLAPLTFVRPAARHALDPTYGLQSLSLFCESFPGLSEVLKTISERCECQTCRKDSETDDFADYKEGCLCVTAMNHFSLLLGHAIADGLGVGDASGLLNISDYIQDVQDLLEDLIRGKVLWNSWFNIAASTALGYSPKGVPVSDHRNRSLVAVQYGSQVVAARWLDLTQAVRTRMCFGVEVAEGQIPRTIGQLTFLESMERITGCSDRENGIISPSKDILDEWSQSVSEKDQSSATLEHAVTGLQAPRTMSLATIICTGSSKRIVDPGKTLEAINKSILIEPRKHQCHHPEGISSKDHLSLAKEDKKWQICSFDHLLVEFNWGDGATSRRIFTNTLDSDLKVNVALSLLGRGCVLRETSTCFLCALKQLQLEKIGDKSLRIVSYQAVNQAVALVSRRPASST